VEDSTLVDVLRDRPQHKLKFRSTADMGGFWRKPAAGIEAAALDAALEMAGGDPAEQAAARARQADKPRKTGRARRPGQISRTIRLPAELVLASRSAAVRAGVSWSDLVAKFIREGLRNER
jgi:hypothetical protein